MDSEQVITGVAVLGVIALDIGLFIAKVCGGAFILFTVGKWMGVF